MSREFVCRGRQNQHTVGPSLAVELQGPVERLFDELDVLLVVEAESRVAEMNG